MAFPTDKTEAVDNTTDVLAAHLNNLEDKVGIDGSSDTNSLDYQIRAGWIDANETWTYASADDPTYTFTISGDLSGKYSAGMRIKLTQTTAKYFIITKVAYSSPNTTITVYGGTDYDLANAAITSPYYSMVKAPQGFPLDPSKWSEVATDTTERTQNSPTTNVWYNLGGLLLSIPIGAWKVNYKVAYAGYKASSNSIDILVTLSTTNNSEIDKEYTERATQYNAITGGNPLIVVTANRDLLLNLTSKASYYLNTMTPSVSSNYLKNINNVSTAIIRATCAYL